MQAGSTSKRAGASWDAVAPNKVQTKAYRLSHLHTECYSDFRFILRGLDPLGLQNWVNIAIISSIPNFSCYICLQSFCYWAAEGTMQVSTHNYVIFSHLLWQMNVFFFNKIDILANWTLPFLLCPMQIQGFLAHKTSISLFLKGTGDPVCYSGCGISAWKNRKHLRTLLLPFCVFLCISFQSSKTTVLQIEYF